MEIKIIGKIIFQVGSTMVEYEKPDEQIYEYLVYFTGGRKIAAPSPENKKKDIVVKNETILNTKEEYYQPSEEEIEEYIKSNIEYRHSVRKIVSHFNKRDIKLDPKDRKLNKIWYNTRMRANRIRDKINNNEEGQWEEKRVSKGKEYLFLKYV